MFLLISGFMGWDFRVADFGTVPIDTGIFLLNSEEWKLKRKPFTFQQPNRMF